MFKLIKKLLSSGEPHASVYSRDELDKHIEMAVEQFDSRLKLIPGYRKKLAPVVENALAHNDALIAELPGPIDLSRQAYSSDPRVNAYFGSADQIEHLFSHSADFREFVKRPESFSLTHGYALMVMSRQEKSVLGHAQVGDMIQSEVMQRVVNFTGHQLVKPADSEERVRYDLRERAFQHLIAEAVLKLARHTEEKADINRERIHLKMELKTLQAEDGALDFGAAEADQTRSRADQLRKQLAEVELKHDKASSGLETINDYFELLVTVLNHSDNYCGLKNRTDCLGQHNVVVDSNDGSEVPYAEIRIGDQQRYGVIVKYPLSELKEQSRIASQMNSIYGQ
ncbi:MAG: hypothetical protein JAY67_17410 [Candidatus Thiodiazotropha taylori]|nr:hypothetical protein [Candidatus Thiodiazotropha taylori]MCG7969772.1 hypothetical protein [Candidatus Thiodiazotropha taylori]